jgi:hypothetical protein
MELDRLAAEHVRTDERLARPQLCIFLEGAIRSYRFVSEFLTNRQPPSFSILTLLLDAPGYELPIEGFRERVTAETARITELIDAGDLLYRDNQLDLYRTAVYEARRSDLDLNTSEAAMLAVLRRKTRIAQVEHFLIEHHKELREFWDKESAFEHEHNALQSAGLLYLRAGKLVLPEDVTPAIWQTLGIDMPTESAKRLFSCLSSQELSEALEKAGARISGSKDVRMDRLLLERIQPRFVLEQLSIASLKEICRQTDAIVTGNKDDLVERVVSHFAHGKDQQEEVPVEPPRFEARYLNRGQFETMFSALLHQELSDILRRFPDSRQTGTKEARIQTLWNLHLSEITLLSELMNRQLEDILHRTGQKLSGSKQARVERIIEHFAGVAAVASSSMVTSAPHIVAASLDAKVAQDQVLFQQKASNPSVSLQPWLEKLLGVAGLIRCYATEDAVPTKQLKNKLAQAAAARDGMLVLLLNDENAFVKAREALADRWLANDEWSKSVACVALAYPLAAPSIHAIVQARSNALAQRIRACLFPAVEIIDAVGGEFAANAHCSGCGGRIPNSARFCPECGERLQRSD